MSEMRKIPRGATAHKMERTIHLRRVLHCLSPHSVHPVGLHVGGEGRGGEGRGGEIMEGERNRRGENGWEGEGEDTKI